MRQGLASGKRGPQALRPLSCKRCGAVLLREAEAGVALCAACLWQLLASASWPQGRKEAPRGVDLRR